MKEDANQDASPGSVVRPGKQHRPWDHEESGPNRRYVVYALPQPIRGRVPEQVNKTDHQCCLDRRHDVLQALKREPAPAEFFTDTGNQQLHDHDLCYPGPTPELRCELDACNGRTDKVPGKPDCKEEGQ